jgi:hypothetical protein
MPTTPRLNADPDMIERMEADLIAKVKAALADVPEIDGLGVYGVFSLDHLEDLLASQLCNEIGVGIGYVSAGVAKGGEPPNVDQSRAAAMVQFRFVAVLAVPTLESCGTRHNATRLLSLMRSGILGSVVADDPSNRTWQFVSENPEISASTKQMLYYAQVWQLALPNIGSLSA